MSRITDNIRRLHLTSLKAKVSVLDKALRKAERDVAKAQKDAEKAQKDLGDYKQEQTATLSKLDARVTALEIGSDKVK